MMVDLATQREAFAIALTDLVFPHRKTRDPHVVQFLYDWELQAAGKGGTNDFLDIRHGHHGFATAHDAAVATAQRIRKDTTLRRDLSHDRFGAAQTHLNIHVRNTPLPIPLNSGGTVDPAHNPGVTVGGVFRHLPGAAGRVAGDVGSGAGKAIADVGGIGKWLGKNIVVVVIVVVLILVMKK